MKISLIVIFVLSLFLIKVLIAYASKLGLQDVPNGRSSHKRVVPKSAGLGFVSAVIIGQFIFNFHHFIEYFYMYAAILRPYQTGISFCLLE